MDLRVKGHRIAPDGNGWCLSRISKSKKDGTEYETDRAYYAKLETTCEALLDRVGMAAMGREDVRTVGELILEVRGAKDELVQAIKGASL